MLQEQKDQIAKLQERLEVESAQLLETSNREKDLKVLPAFDSNFSYDALNSSVHSPQNSTYKRPCVPLTGLTTSANSLPTYSLFLIVTPPPPLLDRSSNAPPKLPLDLQVVAEDLRLFVEVLQTFCADPRDLAEVRVSEARLKDELQTVQRKLKGHELQV